MKRTVLLFARIRTEWVIVLGPCDLYAAQQCAVADASRAKDDVLSVRQIVGEKDAIEVSLVPVGDETAARSFSSRGHIMHCMSPPRHLIAGGSQNCFGRAAYADVKIDPAIRVWTAPSPPRCRRR